MKKKKEESPFSKELFLSKLGVGIWHWKIKENELIWDESMYQLYDIDPEDFSGAYEAWKVSLHPDWTERAENDLKDALEGRKEFDTLFAINSRKGVRYLIGKGEVIRNSIGEPIEMFGFNWDRTEEYLKQIELEKSQEIINQNIKLITIGELAAGIGHELNNPLAIAKGYCSKLSKTLSDEKQREGLAIIQNSLERMEKISNGLRNFARGEIEAKHNFNLNELIRETVFTIKEIYRLENILINFENKSGYDLILLGNRGNIQQVLINLIRNSRDSILEKENKSGAPSEIQIILSDDSDSIFVDIRDEGKGIDSEVIPKIFDSFFSTKPVGKGTGMGMGMVKNILNDHNSTINLLSSSKKGTVFRLTFPKLAANSISKEVVPKELTESNFLNSLKVLFVDDEERLRDIFGELLSDNGAEVILAGDGLEALQRLKEQQFDVIITDFKMPNLDGPSFLEKANECGILRNTKVICMTGGVLENELSTSQRSIIDEFLDKPFDEEKLISSIKECFEFSKVPQGT